MLSLPLVPLKVIDQTGLAAASSDPQAAAEFSPELEPAAAQGVSVDRWKTEETAE